MNGKPVSTEEFKKFLNLEGIDLEEDALELTLDAAISYCNKRNETEYTKDNCPKEVRLAILGLATHYFENRTGDKNKELLLQDPLLQIQKYCWQMSQQGPWIRIHQWSF